MRSSPASLWSTIRTDEVCLKPWDPPPGKTSYLVSSSLPTRTWLSPTQLCRSYHKFPCALVRHAPSPTLSAASDARTLSSSTTYFHRPYGQAVRGSVRRLSSPATTLFLLRTAFIQLRLVFVALLLRNATRNTN